MKGVEFSLCGMLKVGLDVESSGSSQQRSFKQTVLSRIQK